MPVAHGNAELLARLMASILSDPSMRQETREGLMVLSGLLMSAWKQNDDLSDACGQAIKLIDSITKRSGASPSGVLPPGI